MTTWRLEIPLVSETFFWFADAETSADGICLDNSGSFVASRGGSADDVIWMSPELLLVCPIDP